MGEITQKEIKALYRRLSFKEDRDPKTATLLQLLKPCERILTDPEDTSLDEQQKVSLAKLLFSLDQQNQFNETLKKPESSDVNRFINLLREEVYRNVNNFVQGFGLNEKAADQLNQKLLEVFGTLIKTHQDQKILNFLENPKEIFTQINQPEIRKGVSFFTSSMKSPENHQDQINPYYARMLTGIYQKIESLKKSLGSQKTEEAKPGEDKTKPGDKWQVKHDAIYGITTWELTNKAAKDDPRLGTNGQLIVKEIDETGYNYINTEDLIERANLFFDTAQWLIDDDRHRQRYQLNPNPELSKLIEETKELFKEKIKTLELNIDEMKNLETRVSYFNEQYPKLEKAIKQALVDLIWLLHQANPHHSVNQWKEIIREEEKNWIYKQGRPNVINIRKIRIHGDDGSERIIRVISAQMTQGAQTKPSSIRALGTFGDEIPNHIQDITATIDEGKIFVHSTHRGHTSYSRFLEKNRMKRRFANVSDVEKVLSEYVTTLYKADPKLSREQVIEIPLSSMILLTPKKGSKRESGLTQVLNKIGIVPATKFESEHRQLKDVQFALEVLRYRAQPISIRLQDGSSARVKFKPSYMSLPVNMGETGQKLLEDSLQKQVNARGFVEYNESIGLYVQSFLKENKISFENNKIFSNLFENSQDFICEDYLRGGDAAKKISSLKQKIIDINVELNALANALNDLQHKLLMYRPDETFLYEQNQYPFEKLEKEFFKKLKKVDRYYEQIDEIHKKNYRKGSTDHTRLKSDIRRVLRTLPEMPEQDDEIQKKMREFALTIDRHLNCLDLFHSKKYRSALYQFQIAYVLNNQVLGKETESFCKSAEDRTGWLRIQIAAHLYFIQLLGRNPNRYHKPDQVLMDDLLRVAHEMGASLDNTFYNSRARGLQLDASLLKSKIGLEIGNKTARLAKGVFDHLKLNAPSKGIRDRWIAFREAIRARKSPGLR
jgi:hypothetical protein